MNEYEEAQKIEEEMLSVLKRTDLSNLQLLNFLRTVETSAKLLHTSVIDKKFNSVATLCFSVEHDSENKITEREFQLGLDKRIKELNEQPDGLVQACGSDFFDTQKND